MCGIAGFFGHEGSVTAVRKVCAILRAQPHRGPDGAGVFARNTVTAVCAYAPSPALLTPPAVPAPDVVLGHNLLAIQDIGMAARQPMQLGPLTLVFNGEIYNFVELREELRKEGVSFRTQGDTEVLLQLWFRDGVACLTRLRGMFAALLFDARDESLWAVRDAFGIKPLYWAQDRDGVYFSSEMRAMHLAEIVRRRLNAGAALASAAGAAHRFDERAGLYEGIFELPAGHWMRISRSGRETRRWYRLPGLSNERELDADCDSFGQALEQSVRVHLRSVRRVASCLSGGLDSSTLVTFIGKHLPEAGRDFAAFTMNSGAEEDSEIELAREVTAASGVRHQVFDCQTVIPPEDALDMALSYEVPNHVIGPINQYRLLRDIAESGATVVLDGQGGDELMSGYTWWFPALLSDIRGRGIAATADAIAAARVRRLPFSAAATAEFDRIFYDSEAWLTAFMGDKLLGLPRGAVAELPEFRFFFAHDGSWASFRERAYFVDHLYFLLRQEDRLGMRFGLETRVPFVDVELVEAVSSLSSSLLIRDGYLKYPLRRMNSGIPESVRWCTRKRGFWESSEERFPWMAGLSLAMARESDLLTRLFPNLESGWAALRSDQQWRLLQIALLERCTSRADIPALLRDVHHHAIPAAN